MNDASERAAADNDDNANRGSEQGVFDGACAGTVSPKHGSPLSPGQIRQLLVKIH